MNRVVSFFMVMVMLTACSSVRVFDTDTDPNVNGNVYKTFNFHELQASGDTISRDFASRTEILKAAIRNEMTKRGYQYSATRPDLLVNIGVMVKEEVQTRQTNWQTDGRPMYMGQRNYTWKSEEIEVGRYREGTLTLHVVEAAGNRMIWKGSATGVIPKRKEKGPEAVAEAVGKLFEAYPFQAAQ